MVQLLPLSGAEQLHREDLVQVEHVRDDKGLVDEVLRQVHLASLARQCDALVGGVSQLVAALLILGLETKAKEQDQEGPRTGLGYVLREFCGQTYRIAQKVCEVLFELFEAELQLGGDAGGVRDGLLENAVEVLVRRPHVLGYTCK